MCICTCELILGWRRCPVLGKIISHTIHLWCTYHDLLLTATPPNMQHGAKKPIVRKQLKSKTEVEAAGCHPSVWQVTQFWLKMPSMPGSGVFQYVSDRCISHMNHSMVSAHFQWLLCYPFYPTIRAPESRQGIFSSVPQGNSETSQTRARWLRRPVLVMTFSGISWHKWWPCGKLTFAIENGHV